MARALSGDRLRARVTEQLAGSRELRERREAIVRERVHKLFASADDLASRVPEICRDELVVLAEVGALNWTYQDKKQRHRRNALWDAQRATQAPGPLFQDLESKDKQSPLARMTDDERLVSD